MTATPAQLRAVAAALTPHSHQVKEPWYQISPLCDTLDYQQRFMVQQAHIFGNFALWRAVALSLELEALRLEQEAHDPRLPWPDGCCVECGITQGNHKGWCIDARDDNDIATVVRAHWAK